MHWGCDLFWMTHLRPQLVTLTYRACYPRWGAGNWLRDFTRDFEWSKEEGTIKGCWPWQLPLNTNVLALNVSCWETGSGEEVLLSMTCLWSAQRHLPRCYKGSILDKRDPCSLCAALSWAMCVFFYLWLLDPEDMQLGRKGCCLHALPIGHPKAFWMTTVGNRTLKAVVFLIWPSRAFLLLPLPAQEISCGILSQLSLKETKIQTCEVATAASGPSLWQAMSWSNPFFNPLHEIELPFFSGHK